MYIYVITNKTNGRKYVGQTVRSVSARYNRHMSELKLRKHKNKIMQHDYDLGHEFYVKTLDQAAFEFSLDNLEKFWTLRLNANADSGGYNLQSGGKKSFAFSDNVKLRFLGRKTRLGSKLSDESKKKISAKNKGKAGPNLGRTFSDEVKNKMSLSKRGKPNVFSMKSVVDNLGQQFKSISDAAQFHNLKRTTVSNILTGYSKATRCGKSFKYLSGG